MVVTAVDSQHLCQAHTHEQQQTHPFPTDGCVGLRLLLTDLYTLSM